MHSDDGVVVVIAGRSGGALLAAIAGMSIRAFAVVATITVTTGVGHAQVVEDEKVWSSATGAADLTDSSRLSVSESLRAGADSGYDQARTGLELGFRAGDHLGFAGRYTLILRDGNPALGTTNGTNHRFSADGSLRYSLGKVTLSTRMRAQYTTYADEDDRIHLRNKLKASYDAPKRLEPYVALESIYLVSPKAEYRETRIYVGVDWRLSKRFEVGAYYLWQEETNVAMPEHSNILGLELTYLFRRVKNKAADDKPPALEHD